jgi:hypothetical protein
MARSVQGVGENARKRAPVSERTLRGVSERAQTTTQEWPAMGVAVVTATFI